jgi:hypothetical protein
MHEIDQVNVSVLFDGRTFGDSHEVTEAAAGGNNSHVFTSAANPRLIAKGNDKTLPYSIQ